MCFRLQRGKKARYTATHQLKLPKKGKKQRLKFVEQGLNVFKKEL
jgi:hypothetical protein